jgi:hypothetical protein
MRRSKNAHITANKHHSNNKTQAAEMSSDPSPVNNTTFSELYGKFGAAMTAAMTSEGDHPAAPNRLSRESASTYSLRVARGHYQPHHRVNESSVFAKFTLARKAGRTFVEYGLGVSGLSGRQKAELSNAYVFCAPLDAINWASIKEMPLPIDLSSWARVVALNAHAEDMMDTLYVRMRAAPAEYPDSIADILA